MKTQLSLDVQPLDIPYYVQVVMPKVPGRDAQTQPVPIEMVDAGTLDVLCRDFRDRLFKAARREQPPQEACGTCQRVLA